MQSLLPNEDVILTKRGVIATVALICSSVRLTMQAVIAAECWLKEFSWNDCTLSM